MPRSKEENLIYMREYREKNREKVKATQNKWYQANKEKLRVKYKEYYANNTETMLARSKEYRMANPAKIMNGVCRCRATALNLPFDLTPEYIASIWPTDNKCPVLGTEFKRASKHENQTRDLSASVDRIHPAKGYVQGNIVIISMLANRIKNSATLDQIYAVANFYHELTRSFNTS